MHRKWRKIHHHRSPASNCLREPDRIPGTPKGHSIPRPAKISCWMPEIRSGSIGKLGKSSVQLGPFFSARPRGRDGIKVTPRELSTRRAVAILFGMPVLRSGSTQRQIEHSIRRTWTPKESPSGISPFRLRPPGVLSPLSILQFTSEPELTLEEMAHSLKTL